VIERRLRKDVSISENQFGFMPGRSTIEVIYLRKSLMGLYRDRKAGLHMVVTDLEKAYDRVCGMEMLGKERSVTLAYLSY